MDGRDKKVHEKDGRLTRGTGGGRSVRRKRKI